MRGLDPNIILSLFLNKNGLISIRIDPITNDEILYPNLINMFSFKITSLYKFT